jgi:thymidylate kinase
LGKESRVVRIRHLKPQIVLPHRGDSATIVTNPHGKPPRSTLVSVAKILVWLMEEWYARLFQDQKNALLICDRYYHDLLIDPKRYRYGGPVWAASCVGKLIPQPDLWVLLDAPAEVFQARKQEVTVEETIRQRQAYLAFIQIQRDFVVANAARSLEEVVADIAQVITRILVRNDGDHA